MPDIAIQPQILCSMQVEPKTQAASEIFDLQRFKVNTLRFPNDDEVPECKSGYLNIHPRSPRPGTREQRAFSVFALILTYKSDGFVFIHLLKIN